MLFRREVLDGIAAGEITVAYRRWARPSVRVGTHLRTAVGVLEVDAVEEVDEAEVSDADARAAGASDRAALLEGLHDGPDRRLHRVSFHLVGADPRLALRERDLTPEEAAEVRAQLDRWDSASRSGPWTRRYLALIEQHPEVVAATLAEAVGQERLAFKRRVRQLKELGLTESLSVGYRLSPRGRQLLALERSG